MSGHYRMYRGWMDNPVFASEPYSRAQAWEWMIAEAAWKDTRTVIGGKTVVIKRGQFSHSIRYIAKAWKWQKSTVDRFITRLKTETMVGTETGQGQVVITICNYDIYQSSPDEGGTETGHRLGQQRDSSGTEKKEVKESKKDISPDGFAEFYAAYPNKKDPASAKRAYAAALKKTPTDEILRRTKCYAVECEGKEKKWIKHPATWLNAEAWKNEGENDGSLFGQPVQRASPEVELWRGRLVASAKQSGFWPNSWGPKPGEPYCECPSAILREFPNLMNGAARG